MAILFNRFFSPPYDLSSGLHMIASLKRARLGTSLMFFLHGLIVSTWLSRIPAVESHLGLTPGNSDWPCWGRRRAP